MTVSRQAHEALLLLARDFGASLEHERAQARKKKEKRKSSLNVVWGFQADLLLASEKLVNLMHMKGINCRYMGKVAFF